MNYLHRTRRQRPQRQERESYLMAAAKHMTGRPPPNNRWQSASPSSLCSSKKTPSTTSIYLSPSLQRSPVMRYQPSRASQYTN